MVVVYDERAWSYIHVHYEQKIFHNCKNLIGIHSSTVVHAPQIWSCSWITFGHECCIYTVGTNVCVHMYTSCM